MLDETGLLRDAVVAVVADHGESLGENDYYFGHWGVLWENARVPMVVAHPDGRYAGTSVRELVRTVDLMPTLLAWLGIAVAGRPRRCRSHGADRRGCASPTLDAYTEQLEYFPVHSLRTRDWLLVRDRVPQREGDEPEMRARQRSSKRAGALAAERPERSERRLYRRVDGRALQENVADGYPEVLEQLTARLDALHDVDDPGERVAIPVPDAVRQQLRALGYLPEE